MGEGGVTSHCLVEDLSAGGARISGNPTLTVGEHVRLLLQLPGRGPFSLHGSVVRRFGDHSNQQAAAFGISFKQAPKRQSRSVEDTVAALQENNSGNESVVLVVDDTAAPATASSKI